MPSVAVQLPSSLMQVVGGSSSIEVEGSTLREALDDLLRQRPELGVHLFDESKRLRHNVLCLYGETCYGRRDDLNIPLAAGTEIAILQATSGG